MSTTPRTGRAAVIGLGSMGAGMAGSLLRAGFAVAACDVNPDAVARFEAAGGRGAASPAQAAEGALTFPASGSAAAFAAARPALDAMAGLALRTARSVSS